MKVTVIIRDKNYMRLHVLNGESDHAKLLIHSFQVTLILKSFVSFCMICMYWQFFLEDMACLGGFTACFDTFHTKMYKLSYIKHPYFIILKNKLKKSLKLKKVCSKFQTVNIFF